MRRFNAARSRPITQLHHEARATVGSAYDSGSRSTAVLLKRAVCRTAREREWHPNSEFRGSSTPGSLEDPGQRLVRRAGLRRVPVRFPVQSLIRQPQLVGRVPRPRRNPRTPERRDCTCLSPRLPDASWIRPVPASLLSEVAVPQTQCSDSLAPTQDSRAVLPAWLWTRLQEPFRGDGGHPTGPKDCRPCPGSGASVADTLAAIARTEWPPAGTPSRASSPGQTCDQDRPEPQPVRQRGDSEHAGSRSGVFTCRRCWQDELWWPRLAGSLSSLGEKVLLTDTTSHEPAALLLRRERITSRRCADVFTPRGKQRRSDPVGEL